MITLQAVSKRFGHRVVYDNISAGIHPSHRTALIGPNGAGKTLLLRMLTGSEAPDSGQVVVPSDVTLGYLPQELALDEVTTPLQHVLAPFSHLLEVEAVYERLSAAHDSGSAEYRRAADELAKLQAAQHVHDVFSLPSRALAILAGLGIDEPMANRAMLELSGGFRMRAALARLLLMSPDMLLLDEPTNHLDMDSLIWLERFLERFAGGLLIISHDRDFLNRTTGRTIEIRGAALVQYHGTVRQFLAWKEQRDATDSRRTASLQRRIDATERFIERFKAKNTKASAAHSKEKALAKLKEQLPAQQQESSGLRFHLRSTGRSGALPLALSDVSVAYGDNVVFTALSLNVPRGQRVAIVGPNGVGKSTLLKACAGVVEPSGGSVALGHNTTVRYFSQHRLEQLDPDATLYDTVARQVAGGGRFEVQAILGAFMFSGEDVDKKVGVLSGGEKSRLSLAAILASPGNVLLLDEPTNHLDIESVERLADVLEGFDGTLLVVSHDEYLLSRVATRVLEMRPGRLRDVPGSLADYRAAVEAGFGEPVPGGAGAPTGGEQLCAEHKQKRIRKRQERTRLERAVAKAEKQIAQLEEEMAQCRRELESPANATNHELLHECTETFAILESRHIQLLAEWEYAQGELERVVGG